MIKDIMYVFVKTTAATVVIINYSYSQHNHN